jgi:predicted nucleic acid-binding protein
MSRILFDTNVLLDALLNRAPFADHALDLFSRVESGSIDGVVSSCSLTTVYYFGRRSFSEETIRKDLADLAQLFTVQPVDGVIVRRAVLRGGRDLEDDTIVECALAAGCQAIITRNVKDFRGCPVEVMTPGEWLAGR